MRLAVFSPYFLSRMVEECQTSNIWSCKSDKNADFFSNDIREKYRFDDLFPGKVPLYYASANI